jgi:hypothetical protein
MSLANGHGTAAAAAAAAGAPANANVLPLAELMMQLMSRPERAVCEAAVDYFLMVNTLPAVQRPPQLVQPLFVSLVPPLLRGHACYRPDFTTWFEDLDDEEEEFYRWARQAGGWLMQMGWACWFLLDSCLQKG